MISKTQQLSDGSLIHLREAGDGVPVLLFHGVGMQSIAWEPQISELSRDFHVMAVDMPGHGKTPLLPNDPRLPDYVAWGAKVIEALAAEPVSIAGHSMGALIAGGIAIERPELVRRVALLNGVHRRDPEAKKAVLQRAQKIANGKFDVTEPLSRWFGADDTETRHRVACWLREVSPAGYAAAYRAFAEGDEVYADRFETIQCPLLVLTGAEDPNSTAPMTQTMANLAPKGRAVVIEKHRHMVNLTAPEIVNNELRRWLANEEITV